MWTRRALAIMAAVSLGGGVGVFAAAGPAAAGNWAVTVLDPPPGRIEAGRTQQMGFWVLQHGTHPYNWGNPSTLGAVGLVLVDDAGSRASFPGTASAEPAHYTTSVTVPHGGRWQVYGVQGIFMSYHVGTLTVPGTVASLGVPAAPSAADLARYWPGAVRPPVLRVDPNRDPFVPSGAEGTIGRSDLTAVQPGAQTTPASAAAVPADRAGERRSNPAPTLLVAAASLLVIVAAATGRLWWPRLRSLRGTARPSPVGGARR
jgi:hypothetical protein